MTEQTAYDFSLTSLQGQPLALRQFTGKPLLIVNTASKCGFTPQYEGLQTLWSRHQADGLTIIGVPSNDFGRQEPGSETEIGAFCSRNYGVSFPMTSKLHVRGPDIHPLFGWLGRQGGVLSKPRWNFYKYLIGRDGRLANWFSSVSTPGSAKVQRAVESIIKT